MFDQLKQLKQLTGMLGNASELRDKATALFEELGATDLTGEAGGGAVKVVMSGKMEVRDVQIQPAVLVGLSNGTEQDQAAIERLIAAAFNDAVAKAHALIQSKVKDATGDMDLPDMAGLLKQ